MILWFRNDLRTHDNPALHYFLTQSQSKMPRKAIFFISEKQWLAHDWSPIKIDFIKRHAQALVEELADLGIELELVSVPDFSAQITYLKDYCASHNIDNVFANSELEFNERQRDLTCITQGIPLTLYEADVIVPKGKVLNQSGDMFKVFTPFKKAWLKYVQQAGFEYLGKVTSTSLSDESTATVTQEGSLSSAWPLAKEYERTALPTFFQHKVTSYAQHRDIPSIKGTSGISPYLAAGVISPRYVLISLLNKFPDLLLASDSEEFSWLNEIIWREFYRHLMFHEQKLCKHLCFKEKYQNVRWHNNDVLFKAWCEGKTGYPLVDAAMRQLNQTGWMHNRLRMVVASFLTKHLLIDWRLGEKYFMQHLIDGDLASNNGGWQWAASTGCDSQPYFRIFNPIRQSERFDPNGDFIRKYLPELKSIPDKHIHFPEQYIKNHKLAIYVKPVVEHKEARLKALAFYKV
ncbi:deoxyribodipyrimidine photo-lyase [Colwellia sp. 4_MG-2023]|uniref:deoxyribodipyrimidine photo-lyase n=1 Tax=unclassified Colwellia TaxID=196834 RepID=UPI0026E14B48|nr:MULTISPECIES: deoxyribodipyrimidine photo-lyase [unclassified Colwellia]MDO6508245.1 deoxyribodipyrimidine photo-lyase [Colwellia sp. 5_MG-2023]MDO6555306.1 deoxyribodipyrimidine photo-lyase [Colwellia sp. 4_MG-2023]